MNNYIEIRRNSFDTELELDQLVELQDVVYKERGLVFNKESFRKRYIQNPSGRVISFNAFDGDKMVAHYACIPTKMMIEGRVVKGILSMATVTHPEYRGRGLFKTLAKMTYDAAKEEGIEFVVGVANANSFPGFMKHFSFTFVDQLKVKIGYGNNIQKKSGVVFSGYYDEAIMKWRFTCGKHYSRYAQSIEGMHGRFVRTFMGGFESAILDKMSLPMARMRLLPKLYVGIGADVKGLYVNMPKFIKHSPFNLIFMDLTDGKLPKVNKDNIQFQLWDFDVA